MGEYPAVTTLEEADPAEAEAAAVGAVDPVDLVYTAGRLWHLDLPCLTHTPCYLYAAAAAEVVAEEAVRPSGFRRGPRRSGVGLGPGGLGSGVVVGAAIGRMPATMPLHGHGPASQ